MPICYFCHWGWPEPVYKIYHEAVQKIESFDGDSEGALNFGPAHVVWEDENFDSAEWCLKHFDADEYRFTEQELEIVRWSLQELVKIPLNIRKERSDYDGEHPENYPPTTKYVRS